MAVPIAHADACTPSVCRCLIAALDAVAKRSRWAR